LVKDAAEEQARRVTACQFSVPNGTFGPLNPDTTYASFELISALGEGTFGQVSKVREGSTGSLYAQKVIRIPDPRSAYRIEKQVKNEVSIMQKLRHHHIAAVQMFVRGTDSFSIIMSPIADCDLLGYLQQECIANEFPKTQISHLTTWFGCLASALSFAHANMIKHEDIKPRNILIKDHQPYLTDFGCAEDFSALGTSLSSDAPTFGTPVYWAPEDKPRGRSADVFALGCVFSEMLSVRQRRTLEEYQTFRYVAHKDYGYAFRENLPRVYEWLEQLKRPNDSVGELLVEQTLEMLNNDRYTRREAKDIKKALRVEADHVFCRICSY
jgi:serine/threonine protein kinase